MTKVLLKVNNKVMATDGKLVTSEKGTLLKPLLDATKSAGVLFNNYQGESIEGLIQYNDTENVTNFNTMFGGCKALTTIPPLDTSNGTNFGYMFSNCEKLTSIPQLDTSLGTNFSSTFSQCRKLPKIDISHYNISSTSNVNYWCKNCYSLKAVIIRSFGTNYVLNSNAFANCYRILHEANATHNPNNTEDGYVYVPRDMIDILSAETNWSTLQFRALEDYTDDGTTTGKFLDEKAGL